MAVHRISDAPRPLAEDVSARSRNYAISMAVRTVSFVLALIFSGWLRWVFFIGCLILPYVAVMLANEGKTRRAESLPPLANTPPALPAEESSDDDSTV